MAHLYVCEVCGEPGKSSAAATRMHMACYAERPIAKPRNRKMHPFTCSICGLPGTAREPRTTRHWQCYASREKGPSHPTQYPFTCIACGLPGTSGHPGRTWHDECWRNRGRDGWNPFCAHCGKPLKIKGHPEFCCRRCQIDHKAPLGFNPGYFGDDTPQVAYHAGMLLADGNVLSVPHVNARVTIKLQARDREYLDLLRSDLGSTHCTVRDVAQVGGFGGGPTCSFAVSHPQLIADLARWGVVPRKTYNGVPPQHVPDELVPHFARGLVDGDGCIGHWRAKDCKDGQVSIRISCHKSVCDWLASASPIPMTSYDAPASVAAELTYACWTGWVKVQEALQWMGYDDPDLPCLSRKRSSALEILSHRSGTLGLWR